MEEKMLTKDEHVNIVPDHKPPATNDDDEDDDDDSDVAESALNPDLVFDGNLANTTSLNDESERGNGDHASEVADEAVHELHEESNASEEHDEHALAEASAADEAEAGAEGGSAAGDGSAEEAEAEAAAGSLDSEETSSGAGSAAQAGEAAAAGDEEPVETSASQAAEATEAVEAEEGGSEAGGERLAKEQAPKPKGGLGAFFGRRHLAQSAWLHTSMAGAVPASLRPGSGGAAERVAPHPGVLERFSRHGVYGPVGRSRLARQCTILRFSPPDPKRPPPARPDRRPPPRGPTDVYRRKAGVALHTRCQPPNFISPPRLGSELPHQACNRALGWCHPRALEWQAASLSMYAE
eukprot:140711-Prorocentrum_minimum.AAC.4